MKQVLVGGILTMMLLCSVSGPAQQMAAANANGAVPTLVKFNGTLTDVSGKSLSGVVGVTFLLYKDEQGGAPLWMETQNVTPDRNGQYSVMLGSTRSTGLPTDLFASGEARWLAVQPEGRAEQARVLLLSVPYALKAGDAATVGGLPPSAFVLATPAGTNSADAVASAASFSPASAPPPPSTNVTTTGGTANTFAMFTTGTNIQNAIVTQAGTSAINVDGKLILPATGTATSAGGMNSQPEDFIASSYNSATAAAVNQKFQWQAEATGNNTTTPAGTMNLLYGSGTNAPAETGFKVNSKGLVTFATGQVFPGAGTISGVTAGTGLTGGGSSGVVTLNVDTTKIPQLTAANTFTGNQTINGSITGKTASFSGNNSTQIVKVTQNGTGNGIAATANGGTGVSGTGSIGVNALGTGSSGIGLQAGSSSGVGIFSSSATGIPIFAISGTPNGAASIEGYSNSSAAGANTPGVLGYSVTPLGVGTQGLWSRASTTGVGQSQAGVWGDSSSGHGVVGTSDANIAVLGTSGGSQGVWGESFGTGFSHGAGSDGVHGVSHTNQGSGVAGINTATDATGVYGSDTKGYGFVTDSHVSQARGAGGWAKAMAFVDPNHGSTPILVCFNSQIAGSQASTPPCGITYTRVVAGAYYIDFGFQVNDRFVSLTPIWTDVNPTAPHVLTVCRYGSGTCLSGSPTQVSVMVDNNSPGTDSAFYIVVF